MTELTLTLAAGGTALYLILTELSLTFNHALAGALVQ